MRAVHSEHAGGENGGLQGAETKMREGGQAPEAIRSFASAYRRLVAGGQAMIASAELEPVGEAPALGELAAELDPATLDRFVIIKLNGGLATSMGLERPKSLLEAKEGHSFLDVIIGQTLSLRRRHGIRLPLVLMNSTATREATIGALEPHHGLPVEGLPLDFLQSMIPKLEADELVPVSWPAAPALEWCPPGHGDVYVALRSSGMLQALLERGIDYAMISNADNLGSTFDPRIADHLVSERIPFLLEVVEGTEADRKGGHLARRRSDGQLILRETAQTPPEDAESFRDYRRWRYYNTNTLWVDLRVLASRLTEADDGLELPLIVNRKTVDPRDPESTPVVQLESAMGAAIASFPGSRLLCVPRTRFVPVKTTDDLLVLRSDVYTLDEQMRVVPVADRAQSLPYVELDPRFYKLLDAFERRFSAGAPSLRDAQRLIVHGDVSFGAGVVVRGAVELEESTPRTLDPGTVLEA